MKLIDISTPKHPNVFAMVDDEDYDSLNTFKWSTRKHGSTFYAFRKRRASDTLGPTVVNMHREVLSPPDGYYVDHADGNGSNNTKANLRVCTNSENQRNKSKSGNNKSSKFKGVHFQKSTQRFQAYIKVCKRQIHLGYFQDDVSAALAYNHAAISYFGEFAKLNIIKEPATPQPTRNI